MRSYLTLAALLLTCSMRPAMSQSAALIRGRVVDRETGKPLEFVNVFLANTTRGTSTGENGMYRLDDVVPGFYQLVASRVGYEVAAFPVQIVSGDTMRHDFALLPRTVRGPEVEVVARTPSQWRLDLQAFSTQFLGADLFAASCRILNPEVLSFRHDSTAASIVAASDSVVRVENTALGYRLYANLLSFSWRPEMGTVTSRMYLRFEEMRPRNQKESALWIANRKEAYRGSLRHFLRSLVQGDPEAEAFFLFDERGKPFGPDAQGLLFDGGSGYKILAHEGVLRIEYRGSNRVRTNYVRFAMGILHLHTDGYLVENQEFIIDPASDWAQERLSRLVPLDYASR
jgi:Carboxypeptidase regulatory-like domain